MPINRVNQRTFHRRLYAGQLESVTLLKRGNDQQQGTVRSILLHQCRMSIMSKSGQSIQQDIETDTRTTWHIPRTELDRVGVAFLNNLDRIVDSSNRYWEPESGTQILVKLFAVHVCVFCLRIDPPDNPITHEGG